MRRCEPAVAELQATVAKLKTEDQDSKGASARLQARIVKLGLRTAWPFKKDTILALAKHVQDMSQRFGRRHLYVASERQRVTH